MENYTFNFKNEQARVAYEDYLSYLISENISAEVGRSLCVGFIEALNRLDLITQNEYRIVNMVFGD